MTDWPRKPPALAAGLSGARLERKARFPIWCACVMVAKRKRNKQAMRPVPQSALQNLPKAARSPSFVAEFPLRTAPEQERILCLRLEAARHIYNACLGESLRRLERMRESKDWAKACGMGKGKRRTRLFQQTRRGFGFRAGEIQKFAEQCREACWIGGHLGSHDTQTTSRRAFRAVEQYALGKHRRPRFKGRNRLHSVESKEDSVILYRVKEGRHLVLWAGLELPLMLDARDRDEWQKSALSCRTKYVRILRRTVHGRVRWYAQLVEEGTPPQKKRRPVGEGVVGLDLGPSTIAAVSANDATLEAFCPGVADLGGKMRRIQRALERRRRDANPENYHPNGVAKKSVRQWRKSGRYRILAGMAADGNGGWRRSGSANMANLPTAYWGKGMSSSWRKSVTGGINESFVQRRGPSLFVSMLKRKAASAGAQVIEFATRTTRLSQLDHKSGEYVRKPLGQRWHVFRDGSQVQRDLYSAWLARFVEEDRLDVSQCVEHWAAAEPLLRRAASSFANLRAGTGFPLPHAPVAPRGRGASERIAC